MEFSNQMALKTIELAIVALGLFAVFFGLIIRNEDARRIFTHRWSLWGADLPIAGMLVLFSVGSVIMSM